MSPTLFPSAVCTPIIDDGVEFTGCGGTANGSGQIEVRDHPGHLLEVPVVVQQDQAVLDGYAGDQAIY